MVSSVGFGSGHVTYTMLLLIKLNAVVTSQLLAGTALVTAKHYKVFPI
jgi:hypothetical protein